MIYYVSVNARDHAVRIDLGKLGICRKDYGEMCVTGSHHTGDRYDGMVLSDNAQICCISIFLKI